MPILSVTVENADELLNTSYLGAGALGRVERSATGGGAGYSEISTFALVAGTRLYTVYDLAGAIDSWYRIRYSKSDGTSPSSYGDEFQAGDETGGLLCSVYDVEQRLGTTLSVNDRETITELIRELSVGIEGYCGRWFAPRPLQGTTTFRVHTSWGRRLRLSKGIRSITTLGIATQDQPASGGTYTTAADYSIDPPEMERSVGWPGTSIEFSRTGASVFYDARYGAEITGAFGFAAIPYDIQGVAISGVIRRWIGKTTASPAVAVGPEGGVTLLRDLGPDAVNTLNFYRHLVAA